MRIAITGGTGFVGRHLAERFDPADVVVLSRRTQPSDRERIAAALPPRGGFTLADLRPVRLRPSTR